MPILSKSAVCRRGRWVGVRVFIYYVLRLHREVTVAYTAVKTRFPAQTIGEGGVAFDARQSGGLEDDGLAGGLVVHHDDYQPAFMWLVNTADSHHTMGSTVTPPRARGTWPRWLARR